MQNAQDIKKQPISISPKNCNNLENNQPTKQTNTTTPPPPSNPIPSNPYYYVCTNQNILEV
jgi:hypothetical protein